MEQNSENKTQLTCPSCKHKQMAEIPKAGCLAFFKCKQCNEVISVPEESKHCCVICEYSDKTCPVGHR